MLSSSLFYQKGGIDFSNNSLAKKTVTQGFKRDTDKGEKEI